MNKRTFEFYLEYGGNRVQVTPYYKKLEKKTAKEAGQELYRASLQGQIKFVGDDFQLIYNEPITTEFIFIIMLFYRGSWSEYYRGTFTKVNCKFDLAKQVAEPKFKTADSYSKILDKYKDEYDLIELGIPTEPIACTKRPFIQLYCAGASAVTNVHSGRSWETDTSSAIDTQSGIEKYGFSNVGTFREIYVDAPYTSKVNGIYSRYEYEEVLDDKHVLLKYYRWYKENNLVGNDQHVPCVIQAIWSYSYGLIQFGIYSEDDSQLLFEIPADDLNEIAAGGAWELKGNMTNYVFSATGNGSGFATVTKDFLYDIYGRIVHNKESVGKVIALDDFAMSNVSYKRVSSLPDDFIVRQSVHSTLIKTPYGVNDYDEYFTPQQLPALSPTDKYLPIARSSWANTSIWFAYEKTKVDNIDANYSQAYILRDAFNIGEAIKLILSQIDSNISHDLDSTHSQFLYGSKLILPNMPERFYVYATQKTNMIRGTYDQAAQTGKISLESIMNMLRDCFRCYWYIENNSFKIEHISYFLKGLTYGTTNIVEDLTIRLDQFNKKSILLGQEDIEYDVSDLTRKYVFSFADESFLPFTGANLEVDASYVQQDKIEDITIQNFSADVDYMQISADSISNDGFALLCPVSINDQLSIPIMDVTFKENGRPYTTMIQNAFASWAYFIEFYMWDMPALKVTSNVVISPQPRGLKECKTQEISIPFITGLVPFDKIQTFLGEARISEVSEDLDTGILKIKLIYPLS